MLRSAAPAAPPAREGFRSSFGEGGLLHGAKERLHSKIKIRKPVLSDAAFFAQIENDIEVKKFVGGPSNESEARYQKSISEMEDDCRCLTIDSMIHNKPVGRCGIIVDGDRAEIHLILAKQYWKQRFGTEAAFALIELLSKKFPDKMLTAKVHPENAPSLAIVSKLGLTPAGTVESVGYDNGFLRFEKSS